MKSFFTTILFQKQNVDMFWIYDSDFFGKCILGIIHASSMLYCSINLVLLENYTQYNKTQYKDMKCLNLRKSFNFKYMHYALLKKK